VYGVVRRVPAGAVATYGDIAAALGSPRIARQVGRALAALPEDLDVPWWRVVLAAGRLAGAGTVLAKRQASALRREGVRTADSRVVDFDFRRWRAATP
jgi:methylated-DNA-protein-cysteine methyltransferase-like protein